MLGREDRIRIAQSALTRAGALHLHKSLRKDEKLSAILKYMVEKSAIATGRKRNPHRTRANRRRYGDFILVLKGGTLVDIIAERSFCPVCFGAHRRSTEHHCCD